MDLPCEEKSVLCVLANPDRKTAEIKPMKQFENESEIHVDDYEVTTNAMSVGEIPMRPDPAEDEFAENLPQNEENASLLLTCSSSNPTANLSIEDYPSEADIQNVVAEFDKIYDKCYVRPNYDIFSRPASPETVVKLGKAKSNAASWSKAELEDGYTSDIDEPKTVTKTSGHVAAERKFGPKLQQRVKCRCSKPPTPNKRCIRKKRCVEILPTIAEEANTQQEPLTIIHGNTKPSFVISSDNFHPLFVASDGEVNKLIKRHIEMITVIRPTRFDKICTSFKTVLPKKISNYFSVDNLSIDKDRPPHPLQEELYKYRLTYGMMTPEKKDATLNISNHLTEHETHKAASRQIVKICRLCGEKCCKFVVKDHNAVIKMAAVYMPLVVRENDTLAMGLCDKCDRNLAIIAHFMFVFLDHNKMVKEKYQCFLCLSAQNVLLVRADKKTMAKLSQAFYGIYCKLPHLYMGPRLMCKQCQSTIILYEKMQKLLRNTNSVFENPDDRFYTNEFILKPLVLQFRFPTQWNDPARRLETYKRSTANVDTLFKVSLLDLQKLRKCGLVKSAVSRSKFYVSVEEIEKSKNSSMKETQVNPISPVPTSSRVLTEAEYEELMSGLSPRTQGVSPPKHVVRRRAHALKLRPVYQEISSDDED